jgi:hypothetical protein
MLKVDESNQFAQRPRQWPTVLIGAAMSNGKASASQGWSIKDRVLGPTGIGVGKSPSAPPAFYLTEYCSRFGVVSKLKKA